MSAFGCRNPDLGDALVFYGADYASTKLEDYLTKELKSSSPDLFGAGASFIALVVAESLKAEVNRNLCKPFRSTREFGQTRKVGATHRRRR